MLMIKMSRKNTGRGTTRTLKMADTELCAHYMPGTMLTAIHKRSILPVDIIIPVLQMRTSKVTTPGRGLYQIELQIYVLG